MLTTYRIDFPTPTDPCPESLTVVAHRFDTMGAAIRYHLHKHLDVKTDTINYSLDRDSHSNVTGGSGVAFEAAGVNSDGPIIAEFTFRTEPGPTDVEIGANAELAGTTHCPTCGSPEWNAVNVECEDCAAEVEKFDGLLDILDEYDVHVVDEVDDNPEKLPHVGFVPVEKTDLPERLLAWRDAAVQAHLAALDRRVD